MLRHPRITQLDDYENFVGSETIDRIRKKAKRLQHLHIANVNSTYYGGGVAELLTSLTLLMNNVGIKTGWRVIQGAPDFFSITKKMHNALQGGEINLSDRKMEIYEEIIYENAIRNHLDSHNMVIIHDPQPLPMISHYKKNGPWIWRCHVDLSNPNKDLWNYLRPFIEQYDAAIFSIKDYKQKLKIPQVFFMPAIDPFSILNQEMSEKEIKERLAHYEIPTDLPLVVQISSRLSK
jgi:trehalose synthase